MFYLRFFILTGLCLSEMTPASPQEIITPLASEDTYTEWAKALWGAFDIQQGEIDIINGAASLQLSKSFYFLNSEDSKQVLEEVWGNPSGNALIGMLFPFDLTPFDKDAWGVTIEYIEDGYVDDAEAQSIDYDELLMQMQQQILDDNQTRTEKGYATIELVGWASEPYYDKLENKLHWAQELRFSGTEVNTLNYSIRVLGRKGYLVLSFISSMQQFDDVIDKVPMVLSATEFNRGWRYQDFDPELDEVAAYGIGTLISGNLLAKTGLFALGLLLLKKLWFVVLIGMAFIFKQNKGLEQKL